MKSGVWVPYGQLLYVHTTIPKAKGGKASRKKAGRKRMKERASPAMAFHSFLELLPLLFKIKKFKKAVGIDGDLGLSISLLADRWCNSPIFTDLLMGMQCCLLRLCEHQRCACKTGSRLLCSASAIRILDFRAVQ